MLIPIMLLIGYTPKLSAHTFTGVCETSSGSTNPDTKFHPPGGAGAYGH